MIAYVNDNLVPVWVNVREQAFPEHIPTRWWDLLLFADSDGQIWNPWFLGYYVRSYVVTPDLRGILNDGALTTVTLGSEPYLVMLEEALAGYRDGAVGDDGAGAPRVRAGREDASQAAP